MCFYRKRNICQVFTRRNDIYNDKRVHDRPCTILLGTNTAVVGKEKMMESIGFVRINENTEDEGTDDRKSLDDIQRSDCSIKTNYCVHHFMRRHSISHETHFAQSTRRGTGARLAPRISTSWTLAGWNRGRADEIILFYSRRDERDCDYGCQRPATRLHIDACRRRAGGQEGGERERSCTSIVNLHLSPSPKVPLMQATATKRTWSSFVIVISNLARAREGGRARERERRN